MMMITIMIMAMVMMMKMVMMTIIKIRVINTCSKTAGIRCICCKSGSRIRARHLGSPVYYLASH